MLLEEPVKAAVEAVTERREHPGDPDRQYEDVSAMPSLRKYPDHPEDRIQCGAMRLRGDRDCGTAGHGHPEERRIPLLVVGLKIW